MFHLEYLVPVSTDFITMCLQKRAFVRWLDADIFNRKAVWEKQYGADLVVPLTMNHS